jgi:hypothetical protein
MQLAGCKIRMNKNQIQFGEIKFALLFDGKLAARLFLQP